MCHDRYARNDELGVPFAVTFDFETMEAGPGTCEMHDLVVPNRHLNETPRNSNTAICKAYVLTALWMTNYSILQYHAVSTLSIYAIWSLCAASVHSIQAREVFEWSTTLTFFFSRG